MARSRNNRKQKNTQKKTKQRLRGGSNEENPTENIVETPVSPEAPVVQEQPAEAVVQEQPAEPVVEEKPAPVVEEKPAETVVEEPTKEDQEVTESLNENRIENMAEPDNTIPEEGPAGLKTAEELARANNEPPPTGELRKNNQPTNKANIPRTNKNTRRNNQMVNRANKIAGQNEELLKRMMEMERALQTVTRQRNEQKRFADRLRIEVRELRNIDRTENKALSNTRNEMEELKNEMELLKREKKNLQQSLNNEKRKKNNNHQQNLEEMKKMINANRNADKNQNTSIQDLVSKMSQSSQHGTKRDGRLKKIETRLSQIDNLEKKIHESEQKNSKGDMEVNELLEIYKKSIMDLVDQNKKMAQEILEIKKMISKNPKKHSKKDKKPRQTLRKGQPKKRNPKMKTGRKVGVGLMEKFIRNPVPGLRRFNTRSSNL